MKRFMLILVLSFAIVSFGFAQESQENSSVNIYTFFVNVVNEQFNFPLVGFVNIAGGSHSLPQIGFINWNQNNFSSVQLGFVNAAGGNFTGLQMGFVNTTIGSLNGLQFGFVNTSAGKQLNGLQMGFVNTSTGTVNGSQIGFINFADNIENGIPIGFLSIVSNGGYKAVEFSSSETAPLNLSFKIGVEKFYTSFGAAYNPFEDSIREQFIFGVGFGSIFYLSKTFYFNPEITSYGRITTNNHIYVSAAPNFGFNINSNLSAMLSPTLSWEYKNNDGTKMPFFKIAEFSANDNNTLYLGTKIGIRFSW